MIAVSPYDYALFESSTTAVFYVAIAKGTSGSWPGSVTVHKYSQGAVPHTSKPSSHLYVEDRMKAAAIGGVSIGVDAMAIGAISKVGTLEFTISDNGDYLSGLQRSGVWYEGRAVQLWLAHTTSVMGSSDIRLWSGIVREVDRDIRAGTFTVRCESSDQSYNRETPPNSWPSTAGVPSRARGKPKQLVFGEHDLVPTFQLTSASDPTTGAAGGTHGPAYSFGDPAIADGLKGIGGIIFGDGGLALACGGTADIQGSYTGLIGQALIVMPYNAGDKLGIAFDVPLGDFQKGGTYATGASNWIAAVDDDEATATTVDTYSLSSGGPGTNVYAVKLPIIGTSGDIPVISGTQPKVYLGFLFTMTDLTSYADIWTRASLFFAKDRNARCRAVAGSWPFTETVDPSFHRLDLALPARPFTDFAIDEDHTAETASFSSASASGGSAIPLATLADLSEGLLLLDMNLAGAVASLTNRSTAKLYEFRGVRVYADVDYPDDTGIYCHILGYQDDSSGTITTVAGSLIQNPAFIAAFIYRELSGAGAAKVNIDEFKAVGFDRPGWKCARVVDSRTSTDALVSELAELAAFFVWCDAGGIMRCFTADAVATPTATIHRRSVLRGGFIDAKLTPLADVATSFLFRYNFNPITNNYDSTLTCDASTASASIGAAYSALCATAQEKYTAGVVVPVTIETEWIRDDFTAAEWAKLHIANRTSRKWVIKFAVDLTLAVLEPGDTLSFAIADWYDVPSDIICRQFVVAGVDPQPDSNTHEITAIETA